MTLGELLDRTFDNQTVCVYTYAPDGERYEGPSVDVPVRMRDGYDVLAVAAYGFTIDILCERIWD